MDKDLLTQYAEIKKEIKMLESKLEEIQPEVMQSFIDNELEELELKGYGTFIVAKKRKYIYSPTVQHLEVDLKEQKKLEEQNGDADYVENPYLVFKGQKE